VRFSSEFVWAAVIVTVVIALAGLFAWQQVRVLRGLRASQVPPDDRRYQRTRAGRLLICSLLMILVAGMVAGWYGFGLGEQMGDLNRQVADQADQTQLDVPQKRSLTFFTFYWIIAILLLLGMVYLALIDLWAVRRFGLRQIRQLQADRRAMLERQIEILRAERDLTERNGHKN
jgi:MFS family permease